MADPPRGSWPKISIESTVKYMALNSEEVMARVYSALSPHAISHRFWPSIPCHQLKSQYNCHQLPSLPSPSQLAK